jgi:pentatricopeptide repeat protein
VIDIYAQKHDAVGARQVFSEMKAAGLRPNVVTYTSLMDAMMKSGDMNGAMGMLDEMKAAGVRPNKVGGLACVAFWGKVAANYGGLAELDLLTFSPRRRECFFWFVCVQSVTWSEGTLAV